MNRTWLAVGGLALLGLVGTGIWVVDANDASDADDLEASAQSSDAIPNTKRPRGPRGRGRAGRGDGGGDLAGRVEALEQEVASLQREVKMLRAGAGVSGRIAAAGDDPSGAAEDPAFEGAVRDIIANDRKEEQEAELERRRERSTEMVDEAATEFANAAGLSSEQRESVAALWQTEADQVLPLFVAGRTGDRSFSEIREEVDKIREGTDAEAKKLLNASQLEAYEEYRPRGRRGRDGDREGPRSRDRGGPPN